MKKKLTFAAQIEQLKTAELIDLLLFNDVSNEEITSIISLLEKRFSGQAPVLRLCTKEELGLRQTNKQIKAKILKLSTKAIANRLAYEKMCKEEIIIAAALLEWRIPYLELKSA